MLRFPIALIPVGLLATGGIAFGAVSATGQTASSSTSVSLHCEQYAASYAAKCMVEQRQLDQKLSTAPTSDLSTSSSSPPFVGAPQSPRVPGIMEYHQQMPILTETQFGPNNMWSGPISGYWYGVFAGAGSATNDRPGLVVIESAVDPNDTNDKLVGTYPLPGPGHDPTITAEQNDVLTVTTDTDDVYHFNVDSLSYS